MLWKSVFFCFWFFGGQFVVTMNMGLVFPSQAPNRRSWVVSTCVCLRAISPSIGNSYIFTLVITVTPLNIHFPQTRGEHPKIDNTESASWPQLKSHLISQCFLVSVSCLRSKANLISWDPQFFFWATSRNLTLWIFRYGSDQEKSMIVQDLKISM